MSFWSGQTLCRRAEAEKLIVPFDAKSIDCSAYELRVGYEAFVTRDKSDQATELTQGRTPGHMVLGKGESICIPSGQFAFLITKEEVTVPPDAIGFISIKARKKLEGLVNVSGFHVDPGWSSRLIFGVFNAGPQSIIIRPEEKLFLMFFASLDHEAEEKYRYKEKSKYREIPSEFMQKMSAPVPTLYKLNDAVRDLKEEARSAVWRSTLAIGVAVAAASIALAAMRVAQLG